MVPLPLLPPLCSFLYIACALTYLPRFVCEFQSTRHFVLADFRSLLAMDPIPETSDFDLCEGS